MRRLNVILLAVAVLLLAAMLRGIDWPLLGRHLVRGGRYWPLLLIPYGGTCLLWALSWRLLLPPDGERPPLGRLFLIRLAGDSLNQLTPTASLGGEPFKAQRLTSFGIPWQEATASLMVQKLLMVLSLVSYLFLSLALIPLALPGLPPNIAWFAFLGALVLLAGGAAFAFVQRKSPCALLVRLLKRVGWCPAFLAEKEEDLARLDALLAAFFRDHPGRGALSYCLFLAGWMLHALEVYLIFWLLGHALTPGQAFCLDALSQLVAGLGFMVPAALGVQDGGNILLTLGFNLGATLGAGFSIMRRFREAFWLLVGLLVVARER